jgi:hypothetical protein
MKFPKPEIRQVNNLSLIGNAGVAQISILRQLDRAHYFM